MFTRRNAVQWKIKYKAEKSPALSSSRVAVCKILFDVEFFMRIMEDRSGFGLHSNWVSLFIVPWDQLETWTYFISCCAVCTGWLKNHISLHLSTRITLFWTPKNVANRHWRRKNALVLPTPARNNLYANESLILKSEQFWIHINPSTLRSFLFIH